MLDKYHFWTLILRWFYKTIFLLFYLPSFIPSRYETLFYVVFWYFFSTMPQVWSKLDVPSGIYGNFPTTFQFLAFPGDLTCIVYLAQNKWYKILKLTPEILQTVHDPMKPVPHNLDTRRRSYYCFTWNTFLRLVNRTSQIPSLTQGLSTNLGWPKRWNFYHRYLTNFCKYPLYCKVWNVTEKHL